MSDEPDDPIWRQIALAVVGTMFGLVLIAAANVDQTPECWCRVANPFVHDGDTIQGDVLLPWGVTLRNQSIRANDYDAVESSKRRQSVRVTDAEVAKGKEATAALSELLKGGDLYVSPGQRDRDVYGRLLGSFVVVKGGKRVRLAEWAESKGYLRGSR